MTPVWSVVTDRSNAALIARHVRPLWIGDDDLVADVTYGRGLWWAEWRPQRFVAHDLKLDGVDFRHLPEGDGTFDVVAFDPPYIPQGGRATSTVPDMLNRYGLDEVPRSVEALNELTAAGIKECARTLAPGGRLLVKCMDYINGNVYVPGRHHVVASSLAVGLVQVDEFVHYSGSGPQPSLNRDGSPRCQLHSRRAHSFLCVFGKPRGRARNVVRKRQTPQYQPETETQ